MGTKFSPIYATLVLAYLEEKLYTRLEQEFDLDFKHYIQENFKRFLDDCFILFTRSKHNLEQFRRILNDLHPSITYTMDMSKSSLPFLDTMVINKGGQIQTDIYYKPTDSKQYFLYTSCHPKHTRNSIPYNLARRLKTIVSENEVLDQRFNELKKYLNKRKYPSKLIEDAIKKVELLDRTTLLRNTRKSNDSEVIPYVTMFNPFNPEIFSQIRQHTRILHRNNDAYNLQK